MKPSYEIIRGLREDHDLDQIDISKVLGVVQQTYSYYESGKDFPGRYLIKLASYYHVSADYLLGLTDYQGTPAQLNELAVKDITYGNLLTDIMALDRDGKKAVVDYVDLLKLKQQK